MGEQKLGGLTLCIFVDINCHIVVLVCPGFALESLGEAFNASSFDAS